MSPTTLREVDAETLKDWLDQDKAVLIDIRETDEYVREHIAGSRLVPLSGFDPDDFPGDRDKIGVFHCNSGNRTCQAAPTILKSGFAEVYHLRGGIQAWKKAGLPVNSNRKAPISLLRQMQIATGALAVLGILLAVLASPWFMALSALVGVGLILAGITGSCAMSRLLAFMPWNRALAERSQS